ncbi:uncharacterized protein V1518DRAFT_419183 [Limtongia smithiae]|uniref:uncharacterized protein n=1 Tax=Limtongia smithiae TaxID=1125753 RepID=UPI0034CF0FC4
MLALARSSAPFARRLVRPARAVAFGAVPLAAVASTARPPDLELPDPNQMHQAVANLLAVLDTLAPCFPLARDTVHVIHDPSEFYATLKRKILGARSQVFLATLYIGRTENDLIDTLHAALAATPGLHVHILADALRGTREAPQPSCASLVASLVAAYPDRVHARLFHTPNLRGIKKTVVPNRLNEGFGLQHMKIYAFDDDVILSGANLSEDYFSNRQDRYYLVRSAPVTNYYRQIFDAVSSLSYKISPDSSPAGFTLVWPAANAAPEPTKRAIAFIRVATRRLAPIIRPPSSNLAASLCLADTATPTVLYPISQFTPLLHPNTSTESAAIQQLLSMLSADRFSWMFTAGYFNIHPEYRTSLLDSIPERGVILTAAPEANGFYKSPGVSGYLPSAYSLLAEEFVRDVSRRHKLDRIHLLEWQRGVLNQPGGWTYHAKGIWVTPPHETMPCISVIGSSNFTRRSHALDLESNALIVTRDPELRRQMCAEMRHLQEYAREMSEKDFKTDRQSGWGLKLALSVLGSML